MNQQLREQVVHALEENVEENLRRSEWSVYEHYKFVSEDAGNRYVVAPEASREKRVLRPLSGESAALFLRFAGWVEEFDMDKEPGTSRNEKAFEAWVNEFGVLGLDPPDTSLLAIVNSQRVTADYLGMPWRGDVVIGRRNSARGGQNETVENFAWEAWEAHIFLRLYTLVRSQKVVDAESIGRFMAPEPVEFGPEKWPSEPQESESGDVPIERKEYKIGERSIRVHRNVFWSSYVEREVYSQDPELARRWALAVVEDAVKRKIENYCYLTMQGAPGSYELGGGFRCLLGAMWLQMMFLMRADRRCWWCGKPLDPGRRSHARFCDNGGKCRSNWHYHEGMGKSSKEKRRQARYSR